MKTITPFFLFCFFLVFYGCNNEQFVSVSIDKVIKEINVEFEGVSTRRFNEFYNELGSPINYKNFDNTQAFQNFIYDEENRLINFFYASFFEGSNILFTYELDQLDQFTMIGTSAQTFTFTITCIDNVVKINRVTDDGEILYSVFTFSDNTLNLLVKIERNFSLDANGNFVPFLIYDFEYDNNQNITKEIITKYKHDTESFKTTLIQEQIFDRMHNPFLNSQHKDLVALILTFLEDPATGSLIEHISRLSPNNIMSRKKTFEFGNIHTFEYEYLYDKFDYPVSVVRTKFGGNEEKKTSTFNYYED